MANGLTPRQLEILNRSGANTEKALEEVGMAEGITRSTLQGLTFGFADEIEAGIRSILPKEFGGGEYDALVSDIREGLESFRDENKGIAITSEIIGSVVPTVIGSLLTGGAATGPAIARATSSLAPGFAKEATKTIASTTIRKQAALGAGGGAVYGAGVAEGGIPERLAGAGIGAVTGAGIGGAAGAVFPKVGETAKRLIERGVPLTPGQALGGVPKAIEEAATVLPFAGELVGEAQKRAKSQYSNVAIDDILSPLGIEIPKTKTGSEAVEFAEKKIGEEYKKIIPDLDISNPSAIRSRLKNASDIQKIIDATDIVLTDKSQKELSSLINTSIKVLGGADATFIPGTKIRKAEKILGRKASQYSKSPDPDQQDLGNILFNVQSELREELVKQNPDAIRLLDIHSAFKKLLPAQKASIKSSALKEGGEFGPAELLSAISQKDKRLAASGVAPMQKETLEALRVLGEPRGGIARPILEARALGDIPRYALGLGGLSAAPALTAGTIAGVGAAYTPVGVRATRGLLGLASETLPRVAPVTAGSVSGFLNKED